jgi:hypothetical protein
MLMRQDQGRLGIRWTRNKGDGMAQDAPPPGSSGDDEPDQAAPPMGTMVIRTWTEPTQSPGFRARMTYSHSPTAEPKTMYTVDPDEVLDAVRRWLLPRTGTPHQA